jgi:CRP/FNR family transcriptional regulator, cyclic AMP receptor protein
MQLDRAGPADFLSMLAEEERGALRAIGRPHRFRAGATLMHEGLAGDQVMVILSGRVKVTSVTKQGRDTVLGLRESGDLVGELAAIDRQPRSGTVTAVDPVEALAIPGDAFRSFVEEHPRVAMALLSAVSRRFRDADRKRIEFSASDALGRVAARLVELCDRYGEPEDGEIVVEVPLSQEEIAGWCGCSREAVAKALQTMRDLGWIASDRRRVRVLDAAALRERAA